MKQSAPAAGRNREPIRAVLAQHLPAHGVVLEIASGTGEHAVQFASAFPDLEWQPSDLDPVALASIAAWRAESGLPNLRAPIALDVTADVWPIAAVDAILCINMVHIAPWEATLGLFAGAARTLPEAGLLVLYGPYRFDGVTAPSNEDFDRSLRARDPRWGVRDIRELSEAAARSSCRPGLVLRGMVSMPANNHALVFRRA